MPGFMLLQDIENVQGFRTAQKSLYCFPIVAVGNILYNCIENTSVQYEIKALNAVKFVGESMIAAPGESSVRS